jgi:hypothetical protein
MRGADHTFFDCVADGHGFIPFCRGWDHSTFAGFFTIIFRSRTALACGSFAGEYAFQRRTIRSLKACGYERILSARKIPVGGVFHADNGQF